MINQAVLQVETQACMHSAVLKLVISPNMGDSKEELCSHIHTKVWFTEIGVLHFYFQA